MNARTRFDRNFRLAASRFTVSRLGRFCNAGVKHGSRRLGASVGSGAIRTPSSAETSRAGLLAQSLGVWRGRRGLLLRAPHSAVRNASASSREQPPMQKGHQAFPGHSAVVASMGRVELPAAHKAHDASAAQQEQPADSAAAQVPLVGPAHDLGNDAGRVHFPRRSIFQFSAPKSKLAAAIRARTHRHVPNPANLAIRKLENSVGIKARQHHHAIQINERQ